jgi:hypothetical protein
MYVRSAGLCTLHCYSALKASILPFGVGGGGKKLEWAVYNNTEQKLPECISQYSDYFH